MADAIGAVYVLNAVFVTEIIADMVMARVVKLACGHEMIVDQDSAVRIPDLCKSHFLKLVLYKGNENIVDHDAVDVDRDDVAGFDAPGADIVCKNLTSTGSTGDISLKNVIAAEKISIERSTGDVTFEG
jgi:hypothetical protein